MIFGILQHQDAHDHHNMCLLLNGKQYINFKLNILTKKEYFNCLVSGIEKNNQVHLTNVLQLPH